MNRSLDEQFELISRGVEEIIPEQELRHKIENSIKNDKPLIVKLGCDPSRPDLHIGHSVVLRKLRHFQDLGHQAVLVIGDFTAMIGDPTGRNKTRPQLTIEDARDNAKTYLDQSGAVLNMDTLRVVYNSKWLNEMSFSDVIKLSSSTTVARMLERDDFNKRYASEVPISLDLNANLFMYDFVEFGLGYRTDDSVTAMINFLVSPSIRIGYAYDSIQSELSFLTKASHEIFINFDINFRTKVSRSPRYF